MVTYPRTDARVLSTAVAKEIHKNIGGLQGIEMVRSFAEEILKGGKQKGLEKTRYVDDKKITDHYAIIPTGQGLSNLRSLSPLSAKVYEVIVRRFLSIFYPPAVYQKIALTVKVKEESFFSNFKVLAQEGYLQVMNYSFRKDAAAQGKDSKANTAEAEEKEAKDEKSKEEKDAGEEQEIKCDADFLKLLMELKKGTEVKVDSYEIKEGETSPPKRYTSGSIILAMENAGQLIEDEELRAQIKGSGIGTSATRGEIFKKLVNIEYIAVNKKTQVLTPTQLGEMVYDVVEASIKPLLEPKLTASWEKGLTMVAEGNITSDEYMGKLTDFVGRRTNMVKQLNNQGMLMQKFRVCAGYYTSGKKSGN